jgi:glycosyltransferase involved in cell wall biosynthesis
MQYADDFAGRGIQLRLWSFFDAKDLPAWFGSSQLRRVGVVLRALVRLPRVLRVVRAADVVLVQREALPFGPPVVELLAARGRILVWDVDDAVWESFDSPTVGRVPQWLRATGGKYQRLCRAAEEVWAGSEVLAAWCRENNPATHVVPSVVPVPAERPVAPSVRTVGWIGSHSTGPFVESVLPALADMQPPTSVVVVGARPAVPDDLEVELIDWSLAAEEDALSGMRVGLYPIDRTHPLADGKCGLKAVLYMSRGVPPVVTPTPTNAQIVRDGVDGLYAEHLSDWAVQVGRLLSDADLWERLSASAHRRAREEFSREVWAPRLADRLTALTRTGA